MTEEFLLDWLSKEDSSAYGECSGKTLDALVAKGLATFHRVHGRPIEYSRVCLTEAGWADVVRRREASS